MGALDIFWIFVVLIIAIIIPIVVYRTALKSWWDKLRNPAHLRQLMAILGIGIFIVFLSIIQWGNFKNWWPWPLGDIIPLPVLVFNFIWVVVFILVYQKATHSE